MRFNLRLFELVFPKLLVEDAQKTRGETRRALMAAALFTACRHHNATRTHEEMSGLFHVSIRAMCKALMRFEGEVSNVLNTQLGIAERICADMNVSDSDRDSVVLMLQGLPEMEHTPKTIVAGVISMVLGGQIHRVSEASGVSLYVTFEVAVFVIVMLLEVLVPIVTL
jgi:Transcription factor TFIIB repeat